MAKVEKVIKGLEETEIMLKQAVDRGGDMAVMGAFKCLNNVTDAIAMLKEQKSVEPKTGHWICGKYDDIFMCSSCEKYSIDDYPYCHWCGAKMKQEGR